MLNARTYTSLYRGKATASGYRDINMNVKFEGHVCEIQIQLVSANLTQPPRT